jgi:hypothetical protein
MEFMFVFYQGGVNMKYNIKLYQNCRKLIISDLVLNYDCYSLGLSTFNHWAVHVQISNCIVVHFS